MRTGRVVRTAVVLAMVWCQPLGVAHAQQQQLRAGGAATKFGRGFVNLVTGWVEIPKRIHETSQDQGAAAGFTWGLLRGIGYGFVRTTAGLYELITFPFPAPPEYAPIIQPEYVFMEEEKGASTEQQYR